MEAWTNRLPELHQKIPDKSINSNPWQGEDLSVPQLYINRHQRKDGKESHIYLKLHKGPTRKQSNNVCRTQEAIIRKVSANRREG